MRFPAQLDELPAMLGLIREGLKKAKFETKEFYHIELASEEALVNVIKYAYPDSAGEIEIECKVLGPKQLEVEIKDWGVPFDPSSQVGQEDTQAPLEEREIGGLGVYFIFQLMDEVDYSRQGDANVLIMRKGISAPNS